MPYVPSARELILDAAADAINGPGAPGGLHIYRHRTRPIERSEMPGGVLFSGPETVLRQSSAPPLVDRQLTVHVEVRAEGEPSDQVIDPYLIWIEQRLCTDETLSAMIREIELRTILWDQEASKQSLAAAAMEWVITYRTSFGDPTVLIRGGP